MWSPLYHYLNIYKDTDLTECVDTKQLAHFIMSLSEFQQISDFEFKNKPNFPFISISLLDVKNINSWNSNNINIKETNFISIVCAKGNKDNFELLRAICIKIALYLNWQLITEETDEGIENVIF